MNLKKCDFTELHEGFLSPSGDFYPCEFQEHMKTADAILEEMHPGHYTISPQEDLKKQGWAIIHRNMPYRKYLIFFERHLTSEQVRVLKPIVEAAPDEISMYCKRVLKYALDIDLS